MSKVVTRYTEPKTGPHHYVCRDNLQQAHMIEKVVADAALAAVCGGADTVGTVVSGLLQQVPKEGYRWEYVRDYLARVLNVDVEFIADEAVVALWAQALREKRARQGN